MKERKDFMIKKRLLIVVFVISILSTGFLFTRTDIYLEIAKNIDIFTRVYKEITFNYVDSIEPEQFLRAGIKGMLNSLDPYTVFIDEKKQGDLDLLTNGKYGGVGISIGVKNNKIIVFEIMDGYSAQKQGMRIGDVILRVDDHDVDPDAFDEVSGYVKGEPGTNVTIKVFRESVSDTLEFRLIREEIKVKNIPYAGFYPENSNNVFIKLTGFNRLSGEELKNVLLNLKKEKEIKSIILDLRGNPGGLLDVAVDICNQFLAKGNLIVSTKGRDANSLKQYFAQKEPILSDVPLIVLIDEGSASASEIVAGAVQDHDRGIILGEKSFGKGLVQTITPLSYNTTLKLTTSKYFTPSGRCIQKIDYFNKNKVISSYDTIITTSFNTDNNRAVFSGGGIAPDTVVLTKTKEDFVLKLLAQGYIFNFCNEYYEKNDSKNFESLDFNQIMEEFNNYMLKQNFEYISEAEKKLNELIDLSLNDKNYSFIEKNLSETKKQLNEKKKDLIKIYKKEIEQEISIELAQRYSGTEGKTKQLLKYDQQFKVGYEILNNLKIYNKILNKI